MFKAAVIVLAAAMLQGCYVYQYAGPFVTKVESGSDGLNVEKCKVKFNVWSGQFQQVDCATEAVKLVR
jgi:hypothetical protein